jgi:oligoribonuclease NrnB/cAMP/cGMP phosphodiesterase (DHH superfamily)
MNIKSGDTVLAVYHKDFDGIASSICFENAFKNKNVTIFNYPVSYPEVDSVLNTLHYEKYDHVLLMDVSPVRTVSLIDKSPKIHLLDHHDTALVYHNPEKFRFVDVSNSATLLVKSYFEKEYNADLSHLNDFAFLANDYDMWIHADHRSKLINSLYYKYWDEKFRKRFSDGNVTFTEKEMEFFKEEKKKFIDIWNNLKTYDIPDVNGVFCTAYDKVNDICDKLLNEENYDFVFCLNSRSKSVSVRTKREDVNIGRIFEKLGIGGGHPKAAGIDPRTMEDLNKTLEIVCEEIKTELTKEN